MKLSSFIFICLLFFVECAYSQRSNSVEAIYNKVLQENEPASNYISTLAKVDSRHKHYSIAQYLIYSAYKEKAKTRTGLTPYKHTNAFYDSAIIFLEKCQAAIETGDFSKELSFYLPLVNEYGIYESEAQLKQDLYVLFDQEIIELNQETSRFNELAAVFASVIDNYANAINAYKTLKSKYPFKDDLLILAEQSFSEETAPLVNAIQNFEIAIKKHQKRVNSYELHTPLPFNIKPVKSYNVNPVSSKQFEETGLYTDLGQWLDLIQQGRVEKLGNFWSLLTQLYDSMNLQVNLLRKGGKIESPIQASRAIIEKIKFIDSNSAIIPYLNYLEQQQLFLYKSRYQVQKNDKHLIELFGILQQCKLSLDILESRLETHENLPSKNTLFFDKLNLSKASLMVFVSSEKDDLRSEEYKISSTLKNSLVNDFIAGKFNPGFTQYGNTLIPLYEQEAGFLKEGQAITTSVFRISENKMLLGGTIYSQQYSPFVALVENKKIVWLEKGIFAKSAFSFAESYDYFHCATLFKTPRGWGGVYYPGRFNSNKFNEKQSGLLVLFDKNGKKERMLPLPVMQRVDAVCYNSTTNSFILFAENNYMAADYHESEVLYMGNNGEIKWKRALPIKSFSSILKLNQENIFLFANSMEKIPGQRHFKSTVRVFEINGDGVIMKEKELGNNDSAYATQVLQDQNNHWLIFGFNGNNDLYNLRDKDVFFYMLDQTFDNVGGGELTSVEKP